MKNQVRGSLIALLALALLTSSGLSELVAPNFGGKSSREIELELIAIMRSAAPDADKALTCKKLAVYGSAAAVPVVAPLLEDERMCSWARIALEAIPGPEADKALRDATAKVQGRQLVGVINSIGRRGDAKAVSLLESRLQDPDVAVATAAAVSLGKIGGKDSAKALRQGLEKAPAKYRPGLAEGTVLCAEKFLLAGDRSEAAKLYELVRKSDVPRQRLLEATRGYILARGNAGIPLLLEQLRAPEKDLLAIGLRTARELPGREATKALADEVSRAVPERQPLLLLALADRGDASALPAIMAAAKTGSTRLRVAAIAVLERLGNVSTIPLLLDAATSSEPELSQAAKAALTRLPAAGVDAELEKLLGQASGKTRQVILELAGRRQIHSALPLITRSMEDGDPGVRSAAVQSLGLIGTSREAAALAQALEKGGSSIPPSELEGALLSIASRVGADSVPQFQQLAQSSKPELRVVGLRTLAAAGGPQALATVQKAVEDANSEVQDEAVRTLGSWPNTWPDDKAVAEPLLAIARSGKKPSHQVLALRGYLQWLQGNRELNGQEKVKKLDEILPLMRRAEEKRLAMPILQPVANGDSLEILMTFAGDSALTDDACAAIVKMASARNASFSPDQKRKALELVVAKATNEDTKRRAQRMLEGTK